MSISLNLQGLTFGRLTVIERIENTKAGKTRWECSCECGNITYAVGSDLKNGKVKSCGCIQKKHGLSKHRLYGIFGMMKERCFNPNNISYPHYGAKGITIYKEWLEDFSSFYNWSINNGYREGLEIDRINSQHSYNPDNCRWVTHSVQSRNQKLRKDNKSGYRGVKWNKTVNKWNVTIDVNKKRIDLGLYNDIKEAAEVRKNAERKYW